MKTVLLTGGTGSLGTYLVHELISRDDVRLILLVRGASDEAARSRIAEKTELPDTVETYAADLSRSDLGLASDVRAKLAGRVTHILHSAASTRFNSALEEARENNVETTKRMLAFAQACPDLERFGYLSTALVAGKRIGLIKEDEFEHDAGFNNTYQQSKYEAEKLVRESGLPVVIFRPPLVYSPEDVDARGKLTSFLTVLVRLVVSGRIPYVPGTKESAMDIVSVSETARVVCELFMKDDLSYTTYHVTNGDRNLTVDQFHKMMEEEKGAPIPLEYCGVGDAGMQAVREKASHDPQMQATYERAESFLSEPGYPKVFDNEHTLSELGLEKLGEEPAALLRDAVHKAIWNSSR